MGQTLERFPNFGAVYDYQTGEFVRTATQAELLRSLRSMRDFVEGNQDGAFMDPDSGRAVYVADEAPDTVSELIAEFDLDAPLAAIAAELTK